MKKSSIPFVLTDSMETKETVMLNMNNVMFIEDMESVKVTGVWSDGVTREHYSPPGAVVHFVDGSTLEVDDVCCELWNSSKVTWIGDDEK